MLIFQNRTHQPKWRQPICLHTKTLCMPDVCCAMSGSPSVFRWSNLWEIESFTFSPFGIGGWGDTDLTFKVARWCRVPVWALAAGLIAGPLEWQLLKGFLNCTRVDGWLSGGQWTENFQRKGGGGQGEEGRGSVELRGEWPWHWDLQKKEKRSQILGKKKWQFKPKAVK